MANEIYADTSGFYAMLVRTDDKHAIVLRILKETRRRKRNIVTSDYVLDETATLVKVRGLPHLLEPFFNKLDESIAFRIEWTDSERFHECRSFLLEAL